MGFFSKLIGDYQKDTPQLKMAREIVDKLGEEKSVYDSGLSFSGGYHHNLVYEGYGLKIVKPDVDYTYGEGLYVNYNGKKVLDRNTYIPGLWEDLLKEIYISINAILADKREKAINKANGENILEILYISPIKDGDKIGNNISIEATSLYYGYEDEHYKGASYRVIENDKVVLSGVRNVDGEKTLSKYIPGSWEEEIKKYAKEAKLMEEQRKQQQEENCVRENIKRLRKFRENR